MRASMRTWNFHFTDCNSMESPVSYRWPLVVSIRPAKKLIWCRTKGIIWCCIITYWHRWEQYPVVQFLLCRTGKQQMLYAVCYISIRLRPLVTCKDVLKSSKASLTDSYETHFSRTEQKVTETLNDHGSHWVCQLSTISTCHSAKNFAMFLFLFETIISH